MPPIEDPETPEAPETAPPPPEAPAAKSLFLSTRDVFGRLAGAVWSLTPAQAAEGGDALTPVSEEPAQRAFVLAAWGRAPLVRD